MAESMEDNVADWPAIAKDEDGNLFPTDRIYKAVVVPEESLYRSTIGRIRVECSETSGCSLDIMREILTFTTHAFCGLMYVVPRDTSTEFGVPSFIIVQVRDCNSCFNRVVKKLTAKKIANEARKVISTQFADPDDHMHNAQAEMMDCQVCSPFKYE